MPDITLRTGYLKLCFCLILSGLLFISCEKKVEEHYPDKINIKLPGEMIIADPRIMKIISSYIHFNDENDTKYIYQMIIGGYENGVASIYLQTEVHKDMDSKYEPIGYFKYQGRTILVYSALSDFCLMDKWRRQNIPDMKDSLKERTAEEMESLQYMEGLIYKINIFKDPDNNKDSIWVEETIKSPFMIMYEMKWKKNPEEFLHKDR